MIPASLWMAVVVLLTTGSPVLAGGAVAATQQRKQGMQQQMMQQQMQQQAMLQQAQQQQAASATAEVADTVDIEQIWTRMETTSDAWPLMIDFEAKALTVAHFIDRFTQQGIQVRNPPEYYVQMIDDMSVNSPELLTNSFDKVLTLVTVLEYDYDNGENPDELAKRFLGPTQYQENRRRLGLE